MALNNVVVSTDGGRVTISDLINDPLLVPTAQKVKMENIFISSTLLRNGGANTSGVVGYFEGDPSFLLSEPEVVAEGAEIPIGIGQRGTPKSVYGVKKGLGIRLTKEMRIANKMDEYKRQSTQLKNTFERADDRAIKAVITSNLVPTLAVANAWDTTNGKPRGDIAKAVTQISAATPSLAAGGSDSEYSGFKPNTMVMHPSLFPTLLNNDNFIKVYNGNIANENIAYTGKLPGEVFGLSLLSSWAFPIDRVFICERETLGFYSDMWPLQFTPLYPEGGGPDGGPTQSWRSDASHHRAIALDQPKAGLWLTGLTTP